MPCDAETPAIITFTSGSTGVPKAAVRTHGFLLAQHRSLARTLTHEVGDMDLTTLPVVLLAITLFCGKGEGKGVGLPTFLVGFVACVLLNSTGVVAPAVQATATTLSQWLLTVAIAALGVRTSIKSMLDLGPRHLVLVVAETLFLLAAAALVVRFVL